MAGFSVGSGLGEFELVLEDVFEIEHVVEVFYRIARLGAHPFIPDHQPDNFAEIAR